MAITESYNDLVERARRAVKRINRIAKTARLNKATKTARLNKATPKKRAPSARTLIKRAAQRRAALAAPVRKRVAPSRAILKSLAPAVSIAPIRGVQSRPVGGFVPGTTVSWNPVISSNVADIAFDEESDTLYIRFLDGSVYSYDGVAIEVYQRFQAAPSKGKFVHQEVRDHYVYQRIY